ncbi:MAG: ATP-binding cassette domain-containing protein [Ktedonobacterales bacterium]
MSNLAIQAERLTRDFETVRAVDDLSLDIPTGTVFGFLGANGAGKTTTIHLLLGLLEPTQGQARVLGLDTRTQSQSIREQSGALLEQAGLYERLSAEENLRFYANVWRMSATERNERIKELLAHMGLWERRAERVSTWSRGMKQKLAIARVLLHRPKLIFLDEPTAGLDPVAASALRDDLAALAAREGVTVFLTTHNLPEAERLCSLVGVIREGRLLAVGSPDSLREQSGGTRVEIVGAGFGATLVASLRERADVAAVALENEHLLIDLSANDTRAAPIVSAVVAAGGQIEEVSRGKESLEAVFLQLMEDAR